MPRFPIGRKENPPQGLSNSGLSPIPKPGIIKNVFGNLKRVGKNAN